MRENLLWFISGAVLFFLLLLFFGGLYTITPPSGPGGCRLQDKPPDGQDLDDQDLF